MKTTLNLDDALYRRAKIRAAQENRTVSQLIEEGLRLTLDQPSSPPSRRFPLPLIQGGKPAAPAEEMTPDRIAAVLLDQEVEWQSE